MMSKKIIYLIFPLMVLGLMAVPALAATPDHLNLENTLALVSQSRMADSCTLAADLPGDAVILARGGKSGSGGSNSGSSSSGSNSGSNSRSSGGISDGDCCDNGPQGGQGPNENVDEPHRYQYRWSYEYGLGDGEGNDGEGPLDGTGYGAPVKP